MSSSVEKHPGLTIAQCRWFTGKHCLNTKLNSAEQLSEERHQSCTFVLQFFLLHTVHVYFSKYSSLKDILWQRIFYFWIDAKISTVVGSYRMFVRFINLSFNFNTKLLTVISFFLPNTVSFLTIPGNFKPNIIYSYLIVVAISYVLSAKRKV